MWKSRGNEERDWEVLNPTARGSQSTKWSDSATKHMFCSSKRLQLDWQRLNQKYKGIREHERKKIDEKGRKKNRRKGEEKRMRERKKRKKTKIKKREERRENKLRERTR